MYSTHMQTDMLLSVCIGPWEVVDKCVYRDALMAICVWLIMMAEY